MDYSFLLITVIALALIFDFINGNFFSIDCNFKLDGFIYHLPYLKERVLKKFNTISRVSRNLSHQFLIFY